MRDPTSMLLLGAILLLSSSTAAADFPRPRLKVDPEGAPERAPPPSSRAAPPFRREIVSPPEFCPADAMVIYWNRSYGHALIDLCRVVAADDRVICCVPSPKQQSEALETMSAAGINLANVEFFQTVHGSVWIRDYGPLTTYADGAQSIADMRSMGSGDPIPVYLALESGLPWYQSLLVLAGGNYIPDGNGMGFCSAALLAANPSWTIESIRVEMRESLGVDSLVVLPTLQGDVTGHCDMYVKLLGDTLFAVGEYERPDDGIGNDYFVLNEVAATLDAMKNLDGRDFEVVRLPMNPILHGTRDINRSYTNSVIFGDKVMVPVYDTPLDDRAIEIYAGSMPGYEIIGIDSKAVIQNSGAVHCISSEIHSANPLMVLHEPVLAVDAGDAPVLRCRLSPRFADCEVELHYAAGIGGAPETVPAVFSGGVWRAQMPPVHGSFAYWFVARARTGAKVFETILPEGAPLEVFTCEVGGPAVDESRSVATTPRTVWAN